MQPFFAGPFGPAAVANSAQELEHVPYTVSYTTGGMVEAERWVGKLSVAEAVAKRAVTECRAERVEIRNRAGELLFRYPPVWRS